MKFQDTRVYDILDNIRRSIKHFFKYIVKLIRWARFLWDNHSWDYIYIFQVLRFKLKEMASDFRSGGISEEAEKLACEIDQAVKMIDEIIKDDFSEKNWEEHENKWGKITFNENPDITTCIIREKVKTAEDEQQEWKEASLISDMEDGKRRQAYNEFFLYLNKNIRNWWD